MSSTSCSICFYMFFLVFFFSVIPSTAYPVWDVCRLTRNPDFCVNTLQSDPRSKNATLIDLGRIAIDLGKKSATNTSAKINSLLAGAKDPHSKDIYNHCIENYSDAIHGFDDARKYLDGGDYRFVGTQCAGIDGYANTCEKSFKKSPPIPSPLTQENQATGNYGEIIAVISNLLSNDHLVRGISHHLYVISYLTLFAIFIGLVILL